MRYWYRADGGALVAEVKGESARGHSGFGQTPDLDLPAPIACCRWDGAAVVVDAAQLAAHKAELRRRVEGKAISSVQDGLLVTPQGQIRIRWDDLNAYVLIGFRALLSMQTPGGPPFSVQLRRADDTYVTVNAAQFIGILALAADRMAASLAARDTKLDQLAAATAEQLQGLEP